MNRYEQGKNGGEEAHLRLITEMEADELIRLERIIPLYPKLRLVEPIPEEPDLPPAA